MKVGRGNYRYRNRGDDNARAREVTIKNQGFPRQDTGHVRHQHEKPKLLQSKPS